MSTEGATEVLDAVGVRQAPDEPGVYVLFHRHRTVFIGMSETSIRGALGSHERGDYGTLTGHATGYWCEPVERSLTRGRELQLLEAYKTEHNMNVPTGNRPWVHASPPGLDTARSALDASEPPDPRAVAG